MKKIIPFLLFILASYSSFSQAEQNRKIACMTVSCCSVGPFTIDIWKQTTCYYITVQRGLNTSENQMVAHFYTRETLTQKTVEIPEDVLLAGLQDDNGNMFILPKGSYDIINNEIIFTPTLIQSRAIPAICFIQTVSGTIFGQDYHWTIKICYQPIFLRSNGVEGSKGVVSIALDLSDKDKELLLSSDGELVFNEDIHVSDNQVNFTIPKGKYTVNDDGKIYLQNFPMK